MNALTRRSRKKSKGTLKQLKTKTQQSKIYVAQLKQSSEGDAPHHRPTTKNKERSQMNNNFTLKGTGKKNNKQNTK